MKLSDRCAQADGPGGVLFVRLEPSEGGTRQTCWIGSVEPLAMTVNALIAARLIQQDRTFRTGGGVTTSYVMSGAGKSALEST